MLRRCAWCDKPFKPRPQVPDQAFCASPDCQRGRKRQWQQTKLQSDPDYRMNQRAAQRAWSQRNQDYWRRRRDAQAEYPQRDRQQQRSSDQRRNGNPVKMDVCDLPAGLYRITPHPAFSSQNKELLVVEITPFFMTRPRKMTCKERT